MIVYGTTGVDDLADRRKAVRAELRLKGWRGTALESELDRIERNHRKSLAEFFTKRTARVDRKAREPEPAPRVRRAGCVYL